MLRRLLILVPLALLGVCSIGCGHQKVKVNDTRGPDGTAEWKRISCKRMDKKCFQTARAMCPDGYIFTKSSMSSRHKEKAAPVSDDDDTTSTTSKTATSPKVGVNVKTLPPEEKWGDEMYSKRPGTLMIRCAEQGAAVASAN